MLVHGQHPFPAEIERLLREVLELDPQFPDGKRTYVEQTEWEDRFFAWERGERITEGQAALERVLRQLRDGA